MKRLNLEMEDSDMARLEALALQRNTSVDALACAALRAAVQSAEVRSEVRQPIAAYGSAEASSAWDGTPADRTDHADRAQARAERIAALGASSGMVKNNTGIERDGLAYQKALRAEWR